MQKQTVLVEQLRPALTDALERLVKKEPERRGFVIVEYGAERAETEPAGRYLQFCTEPGTGTLLFDEGGFIGIEKLEFNMQPMPDVRCGVLTAEMLIRSVKGWSMSGERELTIIEDDTENRWKGLFRRMKERIAKLGESHGEPVPA